MESNQTVEKTDLSTEKLQRLKEYEKSLKDIIEEIIVKPSQFYELVADSLECVEYQYIKESLIGKCCDNCTNGSCDVETKEKIGVDEQGRPVGEKCIAWSNYELVGRSKVLQIKSISNLR